MNKIIAKKNLSDELVKFEIRTSIAVNEIKVGQYIILNIEKDDAGIPLAVVKTDSEKETITVIVYATDDYSRRLAELNSGNKIFRIDGPFGYPAQIENFGTVLCVGRGPAIIPLLPVLFSLHAAGNDIITILSAQTRAGIILEKEINAISDEVITITDDGSSGIKGSVYQVIGQILRNNKINQVFAIGSATTIKSIYSHTTKYDIPMRAILYLNKSDQKSGHGIFRVSICGTVKAVCVDGYNFNAYYPNFDDMIKRFGSGDFEMHSSINRTIETSIPV